MNCIGRSFLKFFIGYLLIVGGRDHRLAIAANSNDPYDRPKTALVETSKGPFEIEFFWKEAPSSCANFTKLARKEFYNGLTFHRYIPNFVIQGGDPKGDGQGGPGYTIPPEFSDIQHEKGIVGMARLPDPVNPERNSNGSQFYISLAKAPHLDGLYSVFAKVTFGLDVIEKLRPGDKIIRVRLPKRN